MIFVIDGENDKWALLSNLHDPGIGKSVGLFSSVHDLIYYWNTERPKITPSLILFGALSLDIDTQHAITLIRRVKELRTVPLIVVVETQLDEDNLRSYSLDVSRYIRKPIHFQELVDEFVV